MKIQTCRRQITLSKIDEICTSAIPKQISTIPMHTPSFVKIHWYLLKLSSRNENTDLSWADNSFKIGEIFQLIIQNQISIISVHTSSLVKNPLTFTKVITRKWKNMYRPSTDGWSDRYAESLHDTIMPCYYRVAGYKKTDQTIHLQSDQGLCPSTHILQHPMILYKNNKGLAKTEQMSHKKIRPWGYKTFFMLNSAEHEIFSANKYVNANNRHFHIY